MTLRLPSELNSWKKRKRKKIATLYWIELGWNFCDLPNKRQLLAYTLCPTWTSEEVCVGRANGAASQVHLISWLPWQEEREWGSHHDVFASQKWWKSHFLISHWWNVGELCPVELPHCRRWEISHPGCRGALTQPPWSATDEAVEMVARSLWSVQVLKILRSLFRVPDVGGL